MNFKIESFEGPLDLLLHLITKNKLDITDIKIAVLVDQYTEQIKAWSELDLDIASEFLTMAARLIHLKTLSLLPRHEEAEELTAELTGELIEYQLCRELAAKLAEDTKGFKTITRQPIEIEADKSYRGTHHSEVLIKHYLEAVGRGARRLPPPASSFSGIVQKKIVSVSSKIVSVLRNLKGKKKTKFHSLFKGSESRSDVVATFLAVLELVKNKRIKTTEKDGEIIVQVDTTG